MSIAWEECGSRRGLAKLLAGLALGAPPLTSAGVGVLFSGTGAAGPAAVGISDSFVREAEDLYAAALRETANALPGQQVDRVALGHGVGSGSDGVGRGQEHQERAEQEHPPDTGGDGAHAPLDTLAHRSTSRPGSDVEA